jgi:hypothetical protein
MHSTFPMRTPLRILLGLGAIVFGLATLASGGHVLFGDGSGRAAAGQVVEFVVVFNFSAGFVYIAAGAATVWNRRSALPMALGLAGATLLVFLTLGIHIASGRGFEPRTVVAMTVRSGFWIVQALALRYLVWGTEGPPPSSRPSSGTCS